MSHPLSDALGYVNQELTMEGVPLRAIIESVGTPCYVYSRSVLVKQYQHLTQVMTPKGIDICFAVKALANISILKILGKLGCGMDIVSVGELERVLAAGIPANKVVYSGVGKTEQDLVVAIKAGVRQINIESVAEWETIVRLSQTYGQCCVAFRVNPDVDANTHHKISTGRSYDKFGIAIEDVIPLVMDTKNYPQIQLSGLAIHIGSQIQSGNAFANAFTKLADLVKTLRERGIFIDHLDLGGGLPVAYQQQLLLSQEASVMHAMQQDMVTPEQLTKIIIRTVGHLGCSFTIEPGRYLVAPIGVLLSRVIIVKQAGGHNLAVVDAGMNDLMRPALYDALHPVLPLHYEGVQSVNRGDAQDAKKSLPYVKVRVVGPVCESSDDFGTHDMPELPKAGDAIAFTHAGAYCSVLANTYNARPLVSEVLVSDKKYRVIRPRLDIQRFIAPELAALANADY